VISAFVVPKFSIGIYPSKFLHFSFVVPKEALIRAFPFSGEPLRRRTLTRQMARNYSGWGGGGNTQVSSRNCDYKNYQRK
jgi:hypothetical protein